MLRWRKSSYFAEKPRTNLVKIPQFQQEFSGAALAALPLAPGLLIKKKPLMSVCNHNRQAKHQNRHFAMQFCKKQTSIPLKTQLEIPISSTHLS
ncbi:MAG: hypothetical protein R2830_01955 [Saprospiraceae bacterium]